MVCIDDFALRKRHTYGTVMVNLETHRIIDILPSRDTEAVRKWLLTFPNIKLVSKDGASTCASAVTNSHPNAVRVSDRFHANSLCTKKRKEGLTTSEIALLLHSSPKTVSKYLAIPEDEIPEDRKILKEREHQLAIQQKQKEIKEAKRLSAEGYSIQQIGIMMHHTAKTIRNYLDPSYSIINGHYDNRLPGKLVPYEK